MHLLYGQQHQGLKRQGERKRAFSCRDCDPDAGSENEAAEGATPCHGITTTIS